MNRSAVKRAPSRAVLNPSPPCAMPCPDGGVCGSPQAPDCPYPLCGQHVAGIYRYARERTELLEHTTELHIDAIARYTAEHRPRGGSGEIMCGWGAVVYYIETGGAIKIGTTQALRGRLREYPPATRVLALEPGSYRIEAARLAQFERFRTGRREWHYPAPELLAFIEQLAKTGLRVEYPIEPRLVEALRDQGELPESVYGPEVKWGLPRPQVLPPSRPVPPFG